MQRYELKRHVSRRLRWGRRVGPAQPERELSLSVLLHAKDEDALEEALRAVSTPGGAEYGRYLRAEEVRHLIAPGYQDLDAVVAWLTGSGLTVDAVAGARTVVRARGSAEAVSRALEVPLAIYRFPGLRRTRFAAEANPKVPAALAPLVRGIAGLNDLPAARRIPAIPAPKRSRVARRGPIDARGPGGGYTPDVIRRAYAAGGGGSGERIAILQFGGGFSARDFGTFCAQYGLPDGAVSEVSVSGGRNDYRGKTGDGDVEVALDADWVRAAAPEAAIDLFWVPNEDRGWVDFLSALLDRPEALRPSAVSISWGFPEDGFSTSRRYDQTRQLFQAAGLLGISFLSASGDWGASDEVPGTEWFDGQRHVDFPSVVPEVTGVGGTRLVPTATGFAEAAWNDGEEGGATGGGFSRFVRVPAWQEAALGKRAGVTGRGVPDVAAVASPDPGLSIHVHGAWGAAGGTSVAAPIWAGFVAQLNQARRAAGRARLGAANPALYAAARDRRRPFRDIARGDNSYAGVKGFSAEEGWDAATGLGSPDVTTLAKVL